MRRRRPEKREILPDPLFKDLVVAKFINNLMNDGKKSLAESIFYSSIEKIKWSRNQLSAIKRWVDDYNNKKILKTESFKMNREWTYLADIPKVIHSIFNSSKNNLNILNLVSPYIISDLEVMKIIETNKRMQKLLIMEL